MLAIILYAAVVCPGLKARFPVRRVVALVGALALVPAAIAMAPTANATSSYSFSVDFGANTASQLPVTLTLPAPADGSAVTSVAFKWDVSAVPWASGAVQPGTFGGGQTVDTPTCVAGQPCTVLATLTTGTMANATDTIKAVASGTSGYLGTIQTSVPIVNAKPSITAAWPTTSAEWSPWGQSTLTTAPQTSTDGLAIKDVRLYDSTSSTATPIAEADSAPWTLSFDASVLGPQGATGSLRLLVEDVGGNTAFTAEKTLSEPPALVSDDFADGTEVGSTLAGFNQVSFTATVPDSVNVTTAEQYYGPVNWPAGIRGFAVSIDGGAPDQRDWNGSWTGTTSPPRTIHYIYQLPAGITPGTHTLSVTAQTTYGAESTTTSHFVIGDGADFSPLTASGKTVGAATIFAVGRPVTLARIATERVLGGSLVDAGAEGADFTLVSATPSGPELAGAASYSIVGTFAPTAPGTYLLRFCAVSPGGNSCADWIDDPKQQVSQQLTAEYATKLAFARTALSGVHRIVHATVKDAISGRGLSAVPVTIQRRVGTRWVNVISAKSTSTGAVTLMFTKTSRATYRLITKGIAGKDMAAASVSKAF